MKVGYIASVLTDETIEFYPTFWGTIFQDDDDDPLFHVLASFNGIHATVYSDWFKLGPPAKRKWV